MPHVSAKKVKCDGLVPECARCVRLGFPCPGYRSQQNLMFVDESKAVVQKSRRDLPDFHQESLPHQRRRVTILSNEMRFSQNDATSNLEVFGAGMLDPFQSFKVNILPEMQKFIYSFLESEPLLIAVGSPTPMKPVWLPMIMADELVFYSMLYHSAGSLASRTKSLQYSTPLLHYQNKVISLLNKRLRDPTRQVSAQTLITVTGLAAQAIVRNEEDVAHTHMSGLSRMVIEGGGLSKIDLPAVLQEAIIWTDLRYAFTFGRMPNPDIYLRPSMPQFNSLPLIMYLNTPPFLSSLGSGFKPLRVDGRWKVIHGVVHDLRCQAIVFDIAATHGRQLSESNLLVEKLAFAEERLISLVENSHLGFDESTESDSVLEACRLAALVFIRCILLGQPLGNAAAALEVVLLQDPEQWHVLLDLRLWIVFIGFVAAVQEEEMNTWFQEEFARVAERRGLELIEVKSVLIRYLWAESRCETHLSQLNEMTSSIRE